VTWSAYGSYLIIVLLIVLAPGPDTMVVLKNALAGGSRGGLLAAFGIGSGNVVQGTAAALGLGVVIAKSQPVFLTLKWAGAAYLCYLGFQAIRGALRGNYEQLETAKGGNASGFRRWREGFLSNVTNPKVLVLFLSILPSSSTPRRPRPGTRWASRTPSPWSVACGCWCCCSSSTGSAASWSDAKSAAPSTVSPVPR
jgi:threonine/homoserine/homoserine lactone efflux protein